MIFPIKCTTALLALLLYSNALVRGAPTDHEPASGKVVSESELKKNFQQHVQQAAKHPVVVHRNGKPVAAIQSKPEDQKDK